MSWKKWGLAILLTVLMLPLVSVNVIAYQRADDLVHPGKTRALSTPVSFGIARFEDVRYRTRDGVVIAGWYLPGKTSAAVILLHGFAANRSQMLPDAKLLNESGFHVLLIDCRACGDSTGKLNTFGYAEIEDVRGAVEYLAEKPGVNPERIGLAGLSQGGSTAILSAAALPEIRAVAVISTFTSLEDNVASGVRNLLNLPPFPFAPLVVFWGEQISGMGLQQVRPVESIARLSPRPVLVIHGEDDRLIPVENARRLYAAAHEPKETLIVPGAGHSDVRKVGGGNYQWTFVHFFVRWLNDSTSDMKEGRLVGIIEYGNPLYPTSTYTLSNMWQEKIDGDWVRAYAGSMAQDPDQGFLAIHQERDHKFKNFPTPQKLGAVHITAVDGTVLTLATADGQPFFFDVANLRYVQSP